MRENRRTIEIALYYTKKINLIKHPVTCAKTYIIDAFVQGARRKEFLPIFGKSNLDSGRIDCFPT